MLWEVTRKGSDVWVFSYVTDLHERQGFILTTMVESDAMALLQLLNSSGAKPHYLTGP